MTEKELDIIVNASIELSMKKVQKVIPQIKQQVTQAVSEVQKSMAAIDMTSISMKFQQSLHLAQRSIESLKESNKNNELALAINNEDAQNQISQVEKEIDSIQKKTTQPSTSKNGIIEFIKGMGQGLKSGLQYITKYIGAIFNLQKLYGILSSSANAWLNSQNEYAKQITTNMEYMQYAMGSVFAPIIEYIINLIYKVMKGIQSVVYALTGVNIFANASANAYKNMGENAQKASKATKQLSGIHSEINNIQSNADSGSSSEISIPSIDLSNLDTSNSLFSSIMNGEWENVGKSIGEKLNEYIEKINWTQVGNTIAQGINTAIEIGYAATTTFNWMQYGQSISDMVNGLFTNIEWEKAGETISSGIEGNLKAIITSLAGIDWYNIGASIGKFLANIDWLTILGELCIIIFEALYAVIMIIAGLLAEIFKGIGKWLNEKLVQPCIEIFSILWKCICDIFATIGGWFGERFGEAFEGIKMAFSAVGTFFSEIWQGICNVFAIVGEWFGERFNMAVEGIKNAFQGLKDFFSGIWQGICDVFSNVANWFGEKFSKAWEAVKNVFSSGGKIFDGIKDGILNGLKIVINAIIRGINKVVAIPFNGINTALKALRNLDLWGWKPFSWIGTINVPQIPELAKGNVAYSPLIARFGEYVGASTNPEITAPQNILRETFNEVLASHELKTRQTPSGELKQLVVQFGSTKVALEIERLLQQARRQNGIANVTI